MWSRLNPNESRRKPENCRWFVSITRRHIAVNSPYLSTEFRSGSYNTCLNSYCVAVTRVLFWNGEKTRGCSTVCNKVYICSTMYGYIAWLLPADLRWWEFLQFKILVDTSFPIIYEIWWLVFDFGRHAAASFTHVLDMWQLKNSLNVVAQLTTIWQGLNVRLAAIIKAEIYVRVTETTLRQCARFLQSHDTVL